MRSSYFGPNKSPAAGADEGLRTNFSFRDPFADTGARDVAELCKFCLADDLLYYGHINGTALGTGSLKILISVCRKTGRLRAALNLCSRRTREGRGCDGRQGMTFKTFAGGATRRSLRRAFSRRHRAAGPPASSAAKRPSAVSSTKPFVPPRSSNTARHYYSGNSSLLARCGKRMFCFCCSGSSSKPSQMTLFDLRLIYEY
jgi:hypothetical protein